MGADRDREGQLPVGQGREACAGTGRRIGVFICHCGSNIAGSVDVRRAAETVRGLRGVACATDYGYMCSDPGQALIRQSIAEQGLDGIVVAACSPSMHEATFRRAAEAAGLNPYRVEIANIREQCSWVHQEDREKATQKAIALIASLVEKVRGDDPLEPLGTPVTRRLLVIGGGIAGMTVALEVADAGYEVILVERGAELGGRLRQIRETYAALTPLAAPLQTLIERVREHPRIRVLLGSEVESASGYVGSFTVTVRPAAGANAPGGYRSEADPAGGTQHEVGAIVVATGYELIPLSRLGEYGGGRVADVVDALEFERLLAQEVPRRPSDGRVPRRVAFVQCAGSRDPEHGVPYCSKVCCLYTAKQALLYRQRVPDGEAVVFVIDVRTGGRRYEEFVQRAMEEGHVLYLRGKVAKVFRQGDQVIVWGVDTLAGRNVEVAADLVVLAAAVVPSAGAAELGRRLRATTDELGFFREAHPKLRPVESLTAGIFLAGAAQAPKDIAETVSQAEAAAAKVLGLFSRPELVQEPTVATVLQELCAGCGLCVSACPYEARSLNARLRVAEVNAALCQGCGACVVACPNKACVVRNWRPEQTLAMVGAVLGEVQ
ncbi:MAG: CoB--CoM heterodisulfide reductase iron-sulfur subunit A family protein [Anaerolineae bacterium]|nr:CoB--CoM heterodisulfide reductase iron-sulfur subunit A family protein [Anaerolineae bacterium]